MSPTVQCYDKIIVAYFRIFVPLSPPRDSYQQKRAYCQTMYNSSMFQTWASSITSCDAHVHSGLSMRQLALVSCIMYSDFDTTGSVSIRVTFLGSHSETSSLPNRIDQIERIFSTPCIFLWTRGPSRSGDDTPTLGRWNPKRLLFPFPPRHETHPAQPFEVSLVPRFTFFESVFEITWRHVRV